MGCTVQNTVLHQCSLGAAACHLLFYADARSADAVVLSKLCPCVVKSDLFGTTQLNQEAQQGDHVDTVQPVDRELALTPHAHGLQVRWAALTSLSPTVIVAPLRVHQSQSTAPVPPAITPATV